MIPPNAKLHKFCHKNEAFTLFFYFAISILQKTPTLHLPMSCSMAVFSFLHYLPSYWGLVLTRLRFTMRIRFRRCLKMMIPVNKTAWFHSALRLSPI